MSVMTVCGHSPSVTSTWDTIRVCGELYMWTQLICGNSFLWICFVVGYILLWRLVYMNMAYVCVDSSTWT